MDTHRNLTTLLFALPVLLVVSCSGGGEGTNGKNGGSGADVGTADGGTDCAGEPDFTCCGDPPQFEYDAICSDSEWTCPPETVQAEAGTVCEGPSMNNVASGDAGDAGNIGPGPDAGDGDTGGGGGAFDWPNEDPDPETLYFMATQAEGGFDGYESHFDTWHTGAVDTCSFDGTTLSLRVGEIPDAATFFELSFAVEQSAAYDLDPASTELDWTLSDGASAFFFWDDPNVDVVSSGRVEFETCGQDVAGKFSLNDVAEYHSVSFDPWIANITGAFRCAPAQPVDCGL